MANATLPSLSLAMAGTAFTGSARRRAVDWATAGGAGPAIVGVLLLTTVGGMAGRRVAFVAAGLAALGATWFVAAALPPDQPRAATAPGLKLLLAAYRPLVQQRPMLRLYGATALRAVAWSGLVTYFGSLLGNDLGLHPSWIGIAYLLGGAGDMAGSLASGWLLEHVPPRPLVAATNGVLALALSLTFSVTLGTGGTVALLPAAGFAGGVAWVGVTTLLATEALAGAGTTMALNGALANLGAAGGGAIGRMLLSAGGYPALGIGLPAFALAAALLVWRAT